MGEIDFVRELQLDNPKIRAVDLRIVADAMNNYLVASRNIAEHGLICAHPRTGAPMDNPYLKIQQQQGAAIYKMGRVKSNRVFEMMQNNV